MLDKLIASAARYGLTHACAAYLGRKSPRLWRALGPRVTRRYRERWMAASSPRIVNLGSGAHLIEGMLNADVSPRADVYVDLARRLPFADASLDGIFCEEVIEHVSYRAADGLLRECLRCLEPGARIRLSTPDLDYFAALLTGGGDGADPFLEAEAERMLELHVNDRATRKVAMVNAVFYRHEHRFLYDAAALAALLAGAGFEAIARSAFRDPDSALAAYDSHAQRYGHPEGMSLYIEASKPRSATMPERTRAPGPRR